MPSTHEQVNVREGSTKSLRSFNFRKCERITRPSGAKTEGRLVATTLAMNVKIITRQSAIVRYIGRVSQEDKTYEDMEGKLKQVAKGTQGPSCPQASYSFFSFSSFSSKLKLKPYQGLGSAHH